MKNDVIGREGATGERAGRNGQKQNWSDDDAQVCGMKRVGLAAALVAVFGAFAPTPTENVIHVEISGLRNDKGQVLCALF